MRKLLVSMAMIVLALFGAGCADEPQQQAQLAAAQSTEFVATASALPEASNAEAVVCEDVVVTGSMIPEKICATEDHIVQKVNDALGVRSILPLP